MTLTKRTDHAARAKANLLEEFKGLPNWEGLLDSFSGQVQDVEGVLFDLILKRFLDDAVGEQLDGLGRIVGLSRRGLADEPYRVRLRAQILINSGSGTIEDVITVVLLILGAGFTIQLQESFGSPNSYEGDAAFIVVVNEILQANGLEVAGVLKDVKAVGVRAILTWFQDDNTFQFSVGSGVVQSTSQKGFGDTALPAVGGVLAIAKEA